MLPESKWLESVLHEVLYVTEFVMDSLKIFKINAGAHTNAEILSVVEVPGCCVTYYFPVGGSLQHGQVPEGGRHTFQSHRAIELVAHTEHTLDCVILAAHFIGWITGRFIRIRLGDAV